MSSVESAREPLQAAARACDIDIDLSTLASVSQHVHRAVDRQGRAFAFKHFRDTRTARLESQLLSQLAKATLTCEIQALVPCRNGEALAPTPLGPVLVSHWIDGIQVAYDQIDAQGWGVLGRALASLHRALARVGSEEAESLSDLLRQRTHADERERIIRDREALAALGAPPAALALQDARIQLLDTHLDASLAAWPQGGEQLLHNDYNVHNYLFGHRGELYVIDWDRAVSGVREYEVIRCLNHLPLEAPALAESFLSGYQELAALDPQRVCWAFHTAMVSHACKHWPVELALTRAPGAIERLESLEGMVRRLASEGDELRSAITGAIAKGTEA